MINMSECLRLGAISFLLVFLGLSLGNASVQAEKKDIEASVLKVHLETSLARKEFADHEAFISEKDRAFESEANCLANNIYHEARSESLAGMLAVAFVTINRVKSKKFKNTVCEVVHRAARDSSGNPILHMCQFSWYCDGKDDTIKNQKRFDEILALSRDFLADPSRFKDFTDGATHYHTKVVSPRWSSQLVYIMTIDNHMFYKGKI